MQLLEERKTTPLYGLPLQRTEFGDPESIYSYVLRLAFEHRVIPLTLARSGLISRHDDVKGVLFMCRTGAGMLSNTEFAKTTCDIISTSTGVNNLQSGTMLPLRDVVAGHHLLACADRVCLSCIREDVRAKRKMFGRLLWRLDCVSCCPVHGERLVDVRGCPVTEPGSGKPVQMYGVCHRCASIGYSCRPAAELASEDDVETATLCRDLLAVASGLPPGYAATAKHALKMFSRDFLGGYTAIASCAGIRKSLMSRFLNEPQARMQLSSLVNVAKVVGVSAVDLMRGDYVRASIAPKVHVARTQRRKRDTDHAGLRAALSQALDNDSITIAQLSKSLDVDRKLLLAADPQAYRVIVERNLKLLDASRGYRWNSALRRAVAMLRTLRGMGLKPNLKNASRLDSETWTPHKRHAQLLMALASPTHKGVAARRGFPAQLLERIRHLMEHDALRLDCEDLTINHILDATPARAKNTVPVHET